MRYLYISQRLADGVTPNNKGVLKNNGIPGLTHELRGAKSPLTARSTPGQAALGRAQNRYSTPASVLGSSLKVLLTLLTKDFKDQMINDEDKWFTIARARLQLAYNYHRSDRTYDTSDIQLGDLYLIRFTINREKTSHFAFGIGIAHVHGSQSVVPTIIKLVRHEDVEICPVASLLIDGGRLISTNTTGRRLTVFAEDQDSTIQTSSSALSQCRKVVTDILDEIPSTSTRAVKHESVFSTYPVSTQGEEQQYPISVTREMYSPPLELQRQIFPFVKDMFPRKVDWIQWIDNIMSGQHESTGRSEEDRPSYFNKYIPAIRIGILLVCLRKVILQDAVALMNSKSKSGEQGVQDDELL
ncbi:hypothetical protein BGZ47_008428 [Haplosporangium gracile]|nr:hypothetical protein BGZ47_008428 [Haplosporangium gracile]